MTSTTEARLARPHAAPQTAPHAALTTERLLEGLNPPQREAVLHEGSPVLVVAGAGSGKTRVLTRRICYLVSQRKAHPGSILAITFTNKAAAEMRGRVLDLIGNRAKLMWVSTFHSACVRILRSEIGRFNMSRTFSIYDDADAKRLMQLVAHDLDLDPKRVPVRAIMNWVSHCKNELIDYEAAPSRAHTPQQEMYAEAYREYQRRLIAANALDFDDLIMTTVHLLQAFPDLREQYRRRFRHVLVDEYQDTDHAQYVLIRELCAADRNPDPNVVAIDPPELMVVGDSDQSIYAFRGATIRNINDFEYDFPGAKVILLEQNYRSTQTILNAANAVITRNENRKPKNLWSDAGDGNQLVGYVADSEHDEAQFVASEIRRLHDAEGHRYGDAAVFYRTNAQSRAFEEAFIRAGMPYKVVGGVRFYERREVRDAIAYLRAIANRTDDVSLRRILNVPKRGIGDRAEAAVADLAAREGISFGDALRRVDEIPGLASRSVNQLQAFARFLDEHEAMVAAEMPADAILTSVLNKSGYLAELHDSTDPQDETRLENLKELITVAREFVSGVATLSVPEDEIDGLESLGESDLTTGPEGELVAALDPEADLAAGAAEPDASLGAFLERVALVADSDQIPDEPDKAHAGVVTLMTLHTAKGLEFDTVFLTGCEDGVFPHQRAIDERSGAELAEERRLAYVGITRARKRLYISRAIARSAWGSPQHNPPSRFLNEVPSQLIDWQRTESAVTSWRNTSATAANQEWRNRVGYGVKHRGGAGGSSPSGSAQPLVREVPTLVAGDRVVHTAFGMGKVIATSGEGDKAMADVDFGSSGLKRLALRYAPLEKL